MGYLDMARKVADVSPTASADEAKDQGEYERNESNELMAGRAPTQGPRPPRASIGAVTVPTVLRRDHDKIETSRPVVVNGYCPRHNRFLTLRESEAGCCGWCEPDRFEWSPKDRAAIERINTPRAAPDGLTCLECSDPLPAGFKYYCPSCVSARAERAEQEVPL